MTKWEYCEFRYITNFAVFGKIKKKGHIIHFTDNGQVIEDLGDDVDNAKIIAHLGKKGFEMVNCIAPHSIVGEIETPWAIYIFKRPISAG